MSVLEMASFCSTATGAGTGGAGGAVAPPEIEVVVQNILFAPPVLLQHTRIIRHFVICTILSIYVENLKKENVEMRTLTDVLPIQQN